MSLLTNLVNYWKLDEANGNASDSVGGNTATNVGTVTYSAGKIKNGSSHNGSSQYFTYSTPGALTKITISCWVKIGTAPTNGNTMGLVNGLYSTTPVGGYRLFYYNEGNVLKVYSYIVVSHSPEYYNVNKVTYTLTPGTWYHIVLTYDGTTSKLYINAGASTDSTDHSGDIYMSTGNYFRFASDKTWSGAGNYVLNGMLDEIGIWSRALSPAEIALLYNEGSGIQYPFSSNSRKAGILNFFK